MYGKILFNTFPQYTYAATYEFVTHSLFLKVEQDMKWCLPPAYHNAMRFRVYKKAKRA